MVAQANSHMSDVNHQAHHPTRTPHVKVAVLASTRNLKYSVVVPNHTGQLSVDVREANENDWKDC